MIRSRSVLLALPVSTLAAAALADVPRVIADFAPIYSLTAMVMEGVGTPDSLLQPGAEPHDYDMSPGDAARLSDADLVVWVGSGMTPWLTDPIAALAPDAQLLTLLETDGWTALEPRTKAIQDSHGNSHDEHGHDEHGHDGEGHDEGAHDDHEHDAHEHDDHGHDEDENEDNAQDTETHDDHKDNSHADHDHGPIDPHAWVDPDIAAVWLGHIAQALSDLDPENATVYASNAVAAQAEMASLAAEIAELMDGIDGAFILPHDGYQYFETRFDVSAAGSISATDAQAPGPARIAILRDMMVDGGVTCVLTDQETDPAWAALLIDGTAAKTAMIDATAAAYPLGPDAYPQMMHTLAQTLATCLD